MMPTLTTHTTTDQHDLLTTLPTTPPLRIPRRRGTGLLHLLHTVMHACTRGHRQRPRINPDYPRQETVVDRVVRIDPYLYIHSLSG
jgi:hypothetical protein